MIEFFWAKKGVNSDEANPSEQISSYSEFLIWVSISNVGDQIQYE